jgi:hypothetical protein
VLPSTRSRSPIVEWGDKHAERNAFTSIEGSRAVTATRGETATVATIRTTLISTTSMLRHHEHEIERADRLNGETSVSWGNAFTSGAGSRP